MDGINIITTNKMVQMYSSNDGGGAVSSHAVITSSISWLKSRKKKLILHDLSRGRCDLHNESEAAVRWHHLHNLHFWESSGFINYNHSTKQAPVVLMINNLKIAPYWDSLPMQMQVNKRLYNH